MKKVIKLTESDLMRIVKRVINESKYGSFDDEEWYDKDDKFTRVDDMGDDFDEEEFDDFDSFSSKHGHDTKWFGKGDSGRKMFDTYKDKHSKPFKVRTRRGMDEQESNNDGKNFVNKTKETVRTVGNSGEYDYNYIENTIPISKIAKLVNDSITGIQDNEAVVEALFIRISKERDPIAAFKQVRQDYYKQFNSDMMTDIKNDIDINRKYHKESIASLLTKIQKSGNNQSNNNDEESEVVQGGSNDPYEYKFIKRIGNRIYCKYYYRKKYDSNQNRNDAPWIEAKGNGLTSIINKIKFKLPKCMPGDAGPPRYNFK